MKKKFIIVSTVPATLNFFKGQVKFLNNYFDVELLSTYDENLKIIAKREGVKYHAVQMKRPISVFKDLKSLLQLIFKFKQIKPFVVHGNTPKGGLLSITAAWFAKVPHRIYYIHGLRFEGDQGLKRKILIMMESLSCYLATDIIAVSRGVRDNLYKNNITKKDVIVIGNGSANGINPNEYSIKSSISIEEKLNLRSHYNILKNDFIFGYVGRIVGDKGINELVTVFLEINKKYPNTKLLILGNYEDELDPIQDHIKKEITRNINIIPTGYQNDVKPFLNIMDAFVFPSYREGFGVSILEAAMMGLPVICSDISGCNEIIKDGYNGKLVTPKSTSSLFKAMDLFLSQPKLVESMGSVTKNFVLKKYNQEFVWEQALATYLKISKPL